MAIWQQNSDPISMKITGIITTINPSAPETGLHQESQANTMAANTMALYVSKASVAMVFTMVGKLFLHVKP